MDLYISRFWCVCIMLLQVYFVLGLILSFISLSYLECVYYVAKDLLRSGLIRGFISLSCLGYVYYVAAVLLRDEVHMWLHFSVVFGVCVCVTWLQISLVLGLIRGFISISCLVCVYYVALDLLRTGVDT